MIRFVAECYLAIAATVATIVFAILNGFRDERRDEGLPAAATWTLVLVALGVGALWFVSPLAALVERRLQKK